MGNSHNSHHRLVTQQVQTAVPSRTASRTQPADYQIIRTIRQSIYGKVRLARFLRSNSKPLVALKISSLDHIRARTNLEDPEQETRIMRLLSANSGHPHVLKLYDDFIQTDESGTMPLYHWQVLEFCSDGELFDLIDSMHGKSGIGEDRALHYFRQLLSGLKFIHSRGVAHLDISPENVLRHGQSVKIIDFGMARPLPHDGIFAACQGNKPGKLEYMAPEIFAAQDFDGRAADLYSLGVVLFTMLIGFPPYGQPSDADKSFEMIYNGQLSTLLDMWGILDRISPAAVDLLQSLLTSPQHRLNMEQVEAHPWLNPNPLPRTETEQNFWLTPVPEQRLLQSQPAVVVTSGSKLVQQQSHPMVLDAQPSDRNSTTSFTQSFVSTSHFPQLASHALMSHHLGHTQFQTRVVV